MKLRFFTFLVSFLTVMSGAVWGQSGNGSQDDPWIYDITEGNINIEKPGYYIINGNSRQTQNVIDVNAITGKVYITLNNVMIDARKLGARDAGCPFDINPNTDVTIKLKGYNQFVSGYNQAGIHVHVGGKLTITADADDDNHRLHAECLCNEYNEYARGAGIGGAGPYSGNQNAGSFGTIIIEGGKISARSFGQYKGALIEDTEGAGIGGGVKSVHGTIIIKGGDITASCQNDNDLSRRTADAAGIGGGYNGTCDNITILGGKINATSKNGVSIGNGNGYTTSAPSIIIARWDKNTNYPVVTAEKGITETNFIDDRADKKHYSGNVYLPEGTQMYVGEDDLTGVILSAHKVRYATSVIPEGSATYKPLPETMYYGNETEYIIKEWTPDIVINNPDQTTTYQYIKEYWNSNGVNIHTGNNIKTTAIGETVYEALWAVKEKKIRYTQKTGLEKAFKILVPTYENFNTTNITVKKENEESSNLQLSDIGLEINGNQVKNQNNTTIRK